MEKPCGDVVTPVRASYLICKVQGKMKMQGVLFKNSEFQW